MQPGPNGTVAVFDAHIAGWTVRDCVVAERPDGRLSPLPPALRDGRRAVQVPDEYWLISAATAAYGRMKADDDGLRRVIGEEMERAGLIWVEIQELCLRSCGNSPSTKWQLNFAGKTFYTPVKSHFTVELT
jgi:hypothetical protein